MAIGAMFAAGIILAAFTGTYLALVTVFWLREHNAPKVAPKAWQPLPDPDTPGWSAMSDHHPLYPTVRPIIHSGTHWE